MTSIMPTRKRKLQNGQLYALPRSLVSCPCLSLVYGAYLLIPPPRGRGEVGVIPTDTIYAIVCDVENRDAVEKLYKARRCVDGLPSAFSSPRYAEESLRARLAIAPRPHAA